MGTPRSLAAAFPPVNQYMVPELLVEQVVADALGAEVHLTPLVHAFGKPLSSRIPLAAPMKSFSAASLAVVVGLAVPPTANRIPFTPAKELEIAFVRCQD